MTLEKVLGLCISPLNKVLGPSLASFKREKKLIDIKFKMEGPTIIVPESRENPKFLAIDLGKVTAENMLSSDGVDENLLINIEDGQVFTGSMGQHQNMQLSSVISTDIASKMDIKIERKGQVMKHTNVVCVEDILCNISPDDVQLLISIFHHNLLKLKLDVDQLLNLMPAKIVPDDSECILKKEKFFEARLMVDNITINLNETDEQRKDEEERSASPSQQAQKMFQISTKVDLFINIYNFFQQYFRIYC